MACVLINLYSYTDIIHVWVLVRYFLNCLHDSLRSLGTVLSATMELEFQSFEMLNCLHGSLHSLGTVLSVTMELEFQSFEMLNCLHLHVWFVRRHRSPCGNLWDTFLQFNKRLCCSKSEPIIIIYFYF